MMYEMTPRDFWLILSMLLLLTLLVVGLVLYQVRFMREAYIGGKLIDAAGGYAEAAQEIERINAETDLVNRGGLLAAQRGELDPKRFGADRVCKCGLGLLVHGGDSPARCRVWGCRCREFVG